MLRVLVHSPSRTLSRALVLLLESLGFQGQEGAEPAPEVAVWNVCAQSIVPPPPVPTLAVITFGDERDLLELLSLGYRGYLSPEEAPAKLAEAIRAVHAGDVWAERRILARAVVAPRAQAHLSLREAQVMNLLSLGHSNKQIAAQLGLAEGTVKAHVSALLEKHGAKNRVELALKKTSW